MVIKSFDKITRESNTTTYRLFDPTMKWETTIPVSVYEVKSEEYMRPDLLMKSLYDVDDIQNLDIILYINNIDNPLSILPGSKIYYLTNYDQMDNFRYSIESKDISEVNVKKQLVVPNKTTRKDSNRSDYLENGYSLPPVVLDKPKDPVRFEGKDILIGGL